jgi:hypothetical protein
MLVFLLVLEHPGCYPWEHLLAVDFLIYLSISVQLVMATSKRLLLLLLSDRILHLISSLHQSY